MSGDRDPTRRSDVTFPCSALPEEASVARLIGIYPQRQDGLFMQRVKTPGGRITLDQMRGLATLAKEITPGYPLHLTTRQAIELHGVRPEVLPRLQGGLAELGLTGVGACGDTLRNITIPPDNGLRAGTWDVAGLAVEIERFAESLDFIRNLPRKFKITVSGGPDDSNRPWLNDLGIHANDDGTFRVTIAGSLGVRPAPATVLPQAFRLREILPLVGAVLRLFHVEGDRTNRSRARLRHVRERLGDAVFLSRVNAIFEEQLAAWPSHSWPHPAELSRVTVDVPKRLRLRPALGDITPEEILALAELLESRSAIPRLGIEHDLYVFGEQSVNLPPSLETMLNTTTVVACPGTTWCSRGIADSKRVARRILDAGVGCDRLAIAVAGCPNNCPHAAVAEIGLIGRVRRQDGETIECFRLVAGGDKGQTDRLAIELHPAIASIDVPAAIQCLADAYDAALATDPMSFSQFVQRHPTTLRATLSQSLAGVRHVPKDIENQ